MRVFVGFGYNDRDKWIEAQIFPILTAMGFSVVNGKDMHGEILQPEVASRIEQSDLIIGFFTIRDSQGNADFTSHIWVRDEILFALGRDIPVIAIKEEGVKVPDGLMGCRQYIPLEQSDRLACVVELIRALGRRNIRRLKVDPEVDELRKDIKQWLRTSGFIIQYRTKDESDIESKIREGRLEMVDHAFYLNVSDVPRKAYVEVNGVVDGAIKFSSGWVSADAVQVKVS